MGTKIVVDSDDLAQLIYAASLARKTMEMVDAWQEDPSVQRVLAGGFDIKVNAQAMRKNMPLLHAVRRCEQAWNAGLRSAGDRPDFYDEPLTVDELLALRAVARGAPAIDMAGHEGAVRRLRQREMIIAGQPNRVVNWGDGTREAEPIPVIVYKTTPRGDAALESMPSGPPLPVSMAPADVQPREEKIGSYRAPMPGRG